MSLMRRKGFVYGLNDDLAGIFNDWWEMPSWTIGHVYDPEKYDLVPKKDYLQKQIEEKKKQIEKLEEQKKRIEGEIKSLKEG